MRINVSTDTFKLRIASLLFAVLCVLLPAENAFAEATLSYSTEFRPIGGIRDYMDIGGTWNLSTNTDATSTGDRLRLTITNSGTSAALDLGISAVVPNGFVLPSSFGSVTGVSPTPGSCPNINSFSAQQSGNTINFRIQNNQDIPAGCTYNFDLGLTTSSSTFPGSYDINYTVTYDSDIPPVTAQSDNFNTTDQIPVNDGVLFVEKTTTTASAANGLPVDFEVVISNFGFGGLYDVTLTDVLGTNLSGLIITVPGVGVVTSPYTFNYIPATTEPGSSITVDVTATVSIDPAVTTCPVLENTATVNDSTNSGPFSDSAIVIYDVTGALSLTHLPTSYCEFCGDGTVILRLENVGDVTLSDIVVTEDLQASGLTYVPGTAMISIDGGGPVASADPTPAGTPTVFTWSSAQIPELANLYGTLTSSSPKIIDIYFDVRRLDEGLITAVRNISASATYTDVCTTGTGSVSTGNFELPIYQPLPNVIKDGRNYDAGQAGYSDPVYGSTTDDVIWRVNVQNAGLANIEALRINDSIDGNFTINWICPDQSSAETTAASVNGATGGAGCITMTDPFDVDNPFGNVTASTVYDVSPQSTDAYIYYVGRILNGCTNNTNSADVSWGCEVDSPSGGLITIPASTGGSTPGVTLADTGTLSTQVVTGNLNVTQIVTGSSAGQPLGTKGIVIIALDNQTGGSIKNIVLRNLLPAGYVVDNTFTRIENFTQLYGAYDGMIDTVTRIDAGFATPADPLDDVEPIYQLISNTAPPLDSEQDDLLRHGDTVTITIGIVMIEPDLNNYTHYDLVADLDVTPELAGTEDPNNALALTNEVDVSFTTVCDTGTILGPATEVLPVNANPEDLDVAMSAPLYIVTADTANPVPLTVQLTNNGGHVAADYFVYVTFGEAMTIVDTVAFPVPTGCSLTSNPPPRALWDTVGSPAIPAPIPVTATVYECTGPPLSGSRNLIFYATQNLSAVTDDLTFRADVIGEMTLSDGTVLDAATASALNFPHVPTTSTIPPLQAAQIDNSALNYSLDAVRSRVLGFNMTKTLPANCSEDNPPPLANTNAIIGEDCTYHIQSGGWFGFQTPGFILIAVENVFVTDDLPNDLPDHGQGYINHDFTGTTFFPATGTITPIDINGGSGSSALDTNDIVWGFNTTAQGGITQKGEWFEVDITTRLLNSPVDISAPPNSHSLPSTNIARTSFDAVFDGLTIPVSDGASIPGYPVEAIRRVDLTVTEPSLSVVKEVCNETLSITKGINCSPFSTTIDFNDPDAGDTQDDYVYRITVLNQAAAVSVTRAPAYNVAITDVLDNSDLMLIAPGGGAPFNSDGLDNDGDGDVDALDLDGEFLSLSENTADGGTAASFVISHEHSDALDRIDPGQSVIFYYRIDPDDAVAPLQTLSNTVTQISYDSLDGDSGNQNPPQYLNDEVANAIGRARVYSQLNVATASIQMLPLQAQQKIILNVSNTGITAPTQNIVIGEEVLYELRTQIPVANLRDFIIRDELPAGLRCIQAQVIDLNAAPYSAAGFKKNGLDNTTTFAATCDPTGASNVVEWTFGDQELTTAVDNNLFEFTAWFIARVDNVDTNNDGDIITNGTGSTVVTTSYDDEDGVTQTLNHAAVSMRVREPQIVLTKRFTDALDNDITTADAGDIVTVTVTAENTGTATAYNLQILEDLTNTRMTYLTGNETGVIPDNIDTATYGANQPIFNWDVDTGPGPGVPGYALDVNETISFTFQVQVDIDAQPLEILDNTLEASWTSLPDINTALNTLTVPGAIGGDGAENGMRNGVLPNNPLDLLNDYETTISDSISVLPLTFSKTDLDPAINTLPVGDHKRYQIEIDFQNSEGTTHAVLVRDNLAFSGLSYILENEAGFDITYDFQGIASINTLPPSEAAFNSFPADEANNLVTWDIGTVVTQSEDDLTTNAINPSIRITYYARVNNDANTNRDSTLRNVATLNYQNGENFPVTTEVLTDNTTPTVTVIESLLTVVKDDPTNQTSGKATTDLPDAGDLLQYVITVSNNAPGNSIAYDVNLVDTLPADLQWYSGFTPTATINGSPVVDFGLNPPGGEPAGPLVWGRDNGDELLDIPVNGTLIITYQAVVQNTAEANRVLTNSVVADWTSLNGANVYERDGSNAPTYNDYFTAADTATVTVIDNNTITKARNDDSYLNTGNVRVGDTVDYTLTLRLQEGTTRAITLIDTLPEGMEFVGVISVNGNTVAPYSSAGVFTHADISAPVATTGVGINTVTWTLGNAVTGIVNAANAANDDFVIIYRAQVVNDELPITPQDASTNLTNTVVLDYLDGNNAPPAPAARLSDTELIVAQQPIIFTADLSKVRRSGAVSGASVASGETMDFRLSACNSGDAPAYDLIVEDLLPVQLNETTIVSPGDIPGSGTPPVVTINGVVASAATDYVYTPPAGPGDIMRFVFNNEARPVNPGQCAVIEFDISVRAPIGINQVFANQLDVLEYHSLDSDNLNQLERETYAAAGPVLFNMNTTIGIIAPDKILLSPLSNEATIGDEIVYQVRVPGNSGTMSVDLFDLLISDDMAPNLTFVDATLDTSSTYSGSFDTSASTANQVRIAIDLLPVVAGTTQQAVFNIRARVNNDAITNALLPPTPAFGNTATYDFAAVDGDIILINGGSASTPGVDDISIVEPVVTLASKTVANTTQAIALTDAGDVLRYTLVINAAAGATESDAFDISVIDSLGLGMTYIPGTRTVTGVNTIVDPVITGDGIATAQTLSWNLANGTDIDIPEGGSITITYDVIVLDSVLAAQDLSNSAVVQWTSLDGASLYERNGSSSPAYNDYFSGPLTDTITTPDNNTITKTRLTDTYGAGDTNVRIGDIIDYELRLSLQEGTSPNVVLSDVLPEGLAYEETLSINGNTTTPYVAVAPFSHADFAGATVTGDPATGSSTLSWNFGDVVNAGDNNLVNNVFVIVYRARVLNLVHPQQNIITLTNTVSFDYSTELGAATTETSAVSLNLQQPTLIVGKAATPAGGDTILAADELITYTVEIANTGTTPAYDTVLRDIIPIGLRNGAATITVQSIGLAPGSTLPNGNAVSTSLTNLSPVYDASSGIAIWDFDSGTVNEYNIPAGQTLRIVYQVQADPSLSAGLTDITNSAQVQLYYSFDDEAVPSQGSVIGVREIYGLSNIASVTLTTPLPNPLLKENPAVLTASIGEPFTYRITVPDVAITTALHDVRILDNLLAEGLTFVSVTKVSGSQTWTPVNTNTGIDSDTNLVIEDITNGIEIPAGEVIELDITVMLRNIPGNTTLDTFTNTASYEYNFIDGDNSNVGTGASGTTPPMDIVEPTALTLTKSGPANMEYGTPGVFTLDVQNTGDGPAWDVTIVDRLPNPAQGGMCDTPPSNFTAQLFQSDGTTLVTTLVEGAAADFITSFAGAPTCELSVITQSANAVIGTGQILRVSYEVSLDQDNVNGSTLTNHAGVTQWFSWDTAGAGATGEVREYTSALTTPATADDALDHEDAITIVIDAPILVIQKTVVNVSTGQDPGSNAEPGDTLRYTVTITNNGPVDAIDFSLTDEPDRLSTGPALFEPGSMSIISIPVGADASNSDAIGGTLGTGLLDVRNLSAAASGGSTSIVFEMTLAPVITSATVVLNQAQVSGLNFSNLLSDDPNVNGIDDPLILGDEDPTETLIASAPTFQVEKISQDLTGDPAILQPGDTLRYTITVRNIGNENSINTILRDQIPANTAYVANTTLLNGVAVADPSAGVSALVAGMLVNAPENTTAGFMQAVDVSVLTNIATISFDVTVDSAALIGTVISNQGFVSGEGDGSGPFPIQPSDDPGTPLVLDDPTVDVVGDVPVIDSQKTVQIIVDNGVFGQVDPGDTLRYTITISNSGARNATGVTLVDAVPANTTYVPNTVTLNGLAVGQPDGGISPLIAGIDVSSLDLTPPLPGPGAGTVSPGQSAVVIFDVQVSGAATPGTIISNQGNVASNELPDELTDWDGNDANGDQPTVVVVGDVQLLSIIKQVSVVGGGVATAGGQLEYQITVTNIGGIAATNVIITDDLDAPVAGQITYVPGSAQLNGAAAGTSYAAPVLTADYAATYGDLPAGQTAVLRFLVDIDASLAIGTTITNDAVVSWDSPTQTATGSVSLDVGGSPGVANLNGQIWHDANFDDVVDTGERLLQGWSVDVYRNNTLLGSALTDANGVYQVIGLSPSVVSDAYQIRFRAPGAGANTGSLGDADSIFTDGPQTISDIVVSSGSYTLNMNLPIDPNGVVYESILRNPVVGATLTMLRASTSTALPATCFADQAQQGQATLADGYYKFDLNFSQPECQPGFDYVIQVIQPAIGFIGNPGDPSLIIPPITSAATAAAFDVPACLGSVNDVILATANHCEAQASEFAPAISVTARTAGTNYYLKLTLDNNQLPGESQLFNNHIPLDPVLDAALAISKITPMVNVTRGQLVPYTITVRNNLPVVLQDINIVDRFPAGFKYVPGSGRLNDVATEPVIDINNLTLTWRDQTLDTSNPVTIQLLLVVGSGVSEGEYVNRAQAINNLTAGNASEEDTATVRVVPDPTFDCSDVIGKVFDDKNLNGYQDEGEKGIAGARVMTARGLEATADAHGRFHITCAIVPNQDRGSNFILKLDDRSLPTGFRLTTENPRVQRATRGKMLKYNFGATIHRVVRLDMADGVFEKDSTAMRPQWEPRLELLLGALKKAPSILRLSYMADIEDEDLVEDRLDAVKDDIEDRWQDLNCCYKLMIETETFWRRGGPRKQGGFD